MMRRTILTAILGLAAASVPATLTAQQAPSQPRPQMVQRFDHQTVRSLLDAVEVEWKIDQDASGNLTYRASAESGATFVAIPQSCETDAGCLGLVLVAAFEGIKVANPGRLDAFVHRFNDSFPTAKVVRSGPGTVTLHAYINAAYGTTFQNAQAQMLVFGQDIANLSRALVALETGG